MWLVLCSSHDTAALWAYEGLQARGLEPLTWLDPAKLGSDITWDHRLGGDAVSLHVTLADGRRLRHTTIQGVLNRLVSIPGDLVQWAHPEDWDYAAQEFTAFFLSWLSALPCPVINRPTPFGLCGAWRHPAEWVALAGQAGLPTPHFTQTSTNPSGTHSWGTRLVPPDTPVQTVVVVGAEVLGAPVPREVRSGCRRLAQLAETTVLGLEFTLNPAGTWTFAGATPVPDLRTGGARLLEALAHALRGKAV